MALGGNGGDDVFVTTFRRGTRDLLDAAGIVGGAGDDTVDVIGADGAETFAVTGFNGSWRSSTRRPALPASSR